MEEQTKSPSSDVKRAIFTLLKKCGTLRMGLNGNSPQPETSLSCFGNARGVPMTRTCTRAFASWQSLVEFLHESSVLALHVIWKPQNFQWRLRAGRCCRDAILVLRIMCEMIADVDIAVEHNENIISRCTLAPATKTRLVELQSFLDEHRPFVYLCGHQENVSEGEVLLRNWSRS